MLPVRDHCPGVETENLLFSSVMLKTELVASKLVTVLAVFLLLQEGVLREKIQKNPFVFLV